VQFLSTQPPKEKKKNVKNGGVTQYSLRRAKKNPKWLKDYLAFIGFFWNKI
jgi:hypothetical protein